VGTTVILDRFNQYEPSTSRADKLPDAAAGWVCRCALSCSGALRDGLKIRPFARRLNNWTCLFTFPGSRHEQRARPKIMPHVAYICEIWHSAFVKPVIWMGGSREEVKRLPEAVQDSVGFELYRVQCGLDPKDWKPMTSVGSGVKEVRVRDEAGIFRMIYFATRPEGVYVLHCFQKKTQRTSRADLELAMKRFKLIAR